MDCISLCADRARTALLNIGLFFKIHCTVCSRWISDILDKRSLRSPFILTASNQYGLCVTNMPISKQDEKTLKHLDSQVHTDCATILATKPVVQSFGEKQRATMRKLLVTVLHLAKKCNSVASYEEQIFLQYLNDVQVGDRLHSSDTARSMLIMCHREGRTDFKMFLTTCNPVTGHVPFFGAACDKVTDKGKIQFQPCCIRVNYCGYPLVIFNDAKRVYDEGSYDPTSEASGFSLFNKMLESFEEMGVFFFESVPDPENEKLLTSDGRFGKGMKVRVDFEGRGIQYPGTITTNHRNGTYSILYDDGDREYNVPSSRIEQAQLIKVKPCAQNSNRQCNSYAYDGEACYLGQNRGVSYYIRSETDGLGDDKSTITHDPPHSAQLTLKHGPLSEMREPLRDLIKKIYCYYTRSGKRSKQLQDLARDIGVDFRKLHTYFKVSLVVVMFVCSNL